MSDGRTNRKIGSVISMANMGVSLVLGLIYTPILIKYLGDSEYGVYTLAMSLIAYLSMLDLGFGNALIRYTARVRAQGKDEKNLIGMFLLFYSAIAVVAAFIGLVVYYNLNAFFSTSFTNNEAFVLKKIFKVLLINTVIAFPASVLSSVVRSHEQFIFANTVILLQNLINHSLMIVLLLTGFKSVALATVSLGSTIIVACINFFYCLKVIRVKIGFERFDKSFYKEIMLYSSFIFINIVVDQLYASTDKIILGKVCGTIAVAIYGVGVTFQQYFTQFSTSISGVFLPHISKLSVKNDYREEFSAVFLRVGHIQLVLLSILITGFTVYGHIFIKLWVGPEYNEAYYIALLIMVPAIVPLSQNIGISILQALNKHMIRSIMYLCIAIINVLLSIPLAIQFGGIGSAIGTAIGTVLGQILFMNWFYWKKIGLDIPQYWKDFSVLIVRVVPVFLFFYCTLFLPIQGWLGLILKIAIGVFAAIPYYYLMILKNEEKHIVQNILRKFRIVK